MSKKTANFKYLRIGVRKVHARLGVNYFEPYLDTTVNAVSET